MPKRTDAEKQKDEAQQQKEEQDKLREEQAQRQRERTMRGLPAEGGQPEDETADLEVDEDDPEELSQLSREELKKREPVGDWPQTPGVAPTSAPENPPQPPEWEAEEVEDSEGASSREDAAKAEDK